ncbi:MAG TPA: membrane dipeptidase [Vicinamibacterales bacterium]|nr:membrane dipeptidase [Vicinamibacterales bacterium]
MHRRSFLARLAQGVLLARAAPLAARGGQAAPDVESAYAKAIVIDSLCGPFVSAGPGRMPSAEAVDAVARSGITAINFTISDRDYEGTVRTLAFVQALADRWPQVFTIVRRAADIDRAKRDGRLGIMAGFQYTSFLEEDPGRIETFRRLGVRIMQVTYNNRGLFGDGCLEPGNAGLSKAGHDAVGRMNALGVAVDTSHSGYRTTSDAIEGSAAPVLITHSGCAAVYAHPRNKPDTVLRALANRGGYFGVYLMPYLVASPTVPTHEHVMQHLLHALNVCGTDHVGIGSDGSIEAVRLSAEEKRAFDEDIARRKTLGIGAPGEDRYPYVPDLNGPRHMAIIAGELRRRGQPLSVVEKVLGANFRRVLGDIWGRS